MTGKDFLDLIEAKFAKELRSARAWVETDDVYAETHDWLQQFAVGYGLDIASGNFPTLTRDGFPCLSIDGAVHLGNMFMGFKQDADKITSIDSATCDFVVCNYLEGMPSVLGALNEWYRVLKTDGTLALIAANAASENYRCAKGPLKNPRRLHCFTALTLKHYLERALYRNIEIEEHKNTLRVKAIK